MALSSPRGRATTTDRYGPPLLDGLGRDGRSAYSTLLGDGPFRRFFAATFVSSLGDWLGLFAILALTETIVGQGQASRATAFAFSGVMIARILPIMLLGPVAGVYADRWNRKRTLVACDIARGSLMALIPFSQDFLQLVVASFLVEVVSMLFAPAKEATLPNLVDGRRLVQANQLNLTVTYGTLPLGGALLAGFAAIAGVLDVPFLQERPAALAIWANAATFYGSAVLFAGMTLPREAEGRRRELRGEEPSAWEELKEGLRFIATMVRVRALIIGVMAAAFAGGALFTLAKLFVSVLGAGNAAFGLLVAVTGVGVLVGLLTALRVSTRLGQSRTFAGSIGLGGIAAVVTAFMPNVALAATAAFVMGGGAGLAFVTGYTLLQQAAGDEVRGRAFAAFNTGVRLALFASFVLGPFIVGIIGIEQGDGYLVGGVRLTMALSGAVAAAGGLWAWWQLERSDHPPSALHLDGPLAQPGQRPGTFVVLEGGEGAGKSTQLNLLRAAVERVHDDVVVTREPGGTALGEALRDLVLDPEAVVDRRAEALLYAAARAQHVAEVIAPALERGAVVLCDRFSDSSVMYQGVGRELGEQTVEELSRWATSGLVPDLVVLIDIDPSEGLQRGVGDSDRLESAGLPFHRAVNEGYRRRAAASPERFLVVDGSRPVEEVHARIRDEVMALFGPARATTARLPEVAPVEPLA